MSCSREHHQEAVHPGQSPDTEQPRERQVSRRHAHVRNTIPAVSISRRVLVDAPVTEGGSFPGFSPARDTHTRRNMLTEELRWSWRAQTRVSIRGNQPTEVRFAARARRSNHSHTCDCNRSHMDRRSSGLMFELNPHRHSLRRGSEPSGNQAPQRGQVHPPFCSRPIIICDNPEMSNPR